MNAAVRIAVANMHAANRRRRQSDGAQPQPVPTPPAPPVAARPKEHPMLKELQGAELAREYRTTGQTLLVATEITTGIMSGSRTFAVVPPDTTYKSLKVSEIVELEPGDSVEVYSGGLFLVRRYTITNIDGWHFELAPRRWALTKALRGDGVRTITLQRRR
jgi:hypothetical protein